MNLDHAVGTIVSKGFTERQARFLVLVARHAGVCVMRQYSAFGGVVFGHTTRRFFSTLDRLGWVSTYDCARKRARIYHVRHRELYDAIGDPESRLRRPPTVPRALERIMLLDVILREPDLVWLATPEEKMAQVSMSTSITPDAMPQMAAPQGSWASRWLGKLPPPSGRPLNDARRLDAPDQGIPLPTAASASQPVQPKNNP